MCQEQCAVPSLPTPPHHPTHLPPLIFFFAPFGNWGGFDKTEMSGNTTRNFLGPGAAGSGRTELGKLNFHDF